jgi:hypothetical protein
MMLVKILEFGSNWWARFGRDPHDRYGTRDMRPTSIPLVCAAEAR